MKTTDQVYSVKQRHVIDFAFDENVASVFPDMIRRSVPGYDTIISMLGVLSARYVIENSNVYDIGCSLGASLLSIYSQVQVPSVHYIGVDNSSEMLNRCKDAVEKVIPLDQLSLIERSAEDIKFSNSSLTVMNFTLQFMRPEVRLDLVRTIYKGLLPGGVFVLSEKLAQEESDHETMTTLHHQFKSLNGYSDLEISQKRTALENVMLLDKREQHIDRLKSVGFKQVLPWFQCFNFTSFIAVK
ncbi:MAG: carboxy-S-adenosyl-L-methionine synthase CmoA [Gammaproteobacteria bacterium]|nr:carboxy-S-adenosyl-L-methionine synthase CmoA [Gammaproteobacteria bacterium]